MLKDTTTHHIEEHAHVYTIALLMCIFTIGVFLLHRSHTPLLGTVVFEEQTAQVTYTPLKPLFNIGPLTTPGDTANYLQKMIFLAIGIAILLAILMIVWGGIQYMASEAFTEKQDAVNRMTMALFGLIIALGAYLLLNIINPQLVTINLGSGAPVDIPGTRIITPPPSGTETNEEALKRLKDAEGITVSSTGNCSNRNDSTCTSLDGIKDTTITSLIGIKNDCESFGVPCPITVTGGTEVGHSSGIQSHGNGDKIDIRYNENDRVTQWITSEIQQTNGGGPILLDTTYRTILRGSNGAFEMEFRREQNASGRQHWDIKTVRQIT